MKAELVRELSSVEGFDNPKISKEQYMTPPQLAADLVFSAYMQGDIENKKVIDAGTGTGILAIAAFKLGGKVTAVEEDPEALEQAKENAEKLGADIEFLQEDFTDLELGFDTCVMNPPFSVHSEEGEQFVRKAFEVADNVYTLADGNLLEVIKKLAAPTEYIIESESVEIGLPATYGFHTEETRETEINIVSARKK